MRRKLQAMGQLNRREFLRLTGSSAAALLAAPTLLSAPALAASQKKTIWFATLFHSDAPAMDMIIKKFNAAQVDLEVDLTQGSWTEYYAQLYNTVVAGKAPQIAICHDWRIAATHPILVPLNQSPVGNLLEKAGFNKNDYIPYSWAISDVGGNHYGIPLDQHMYGIYYNKKLFRDAGLDPERPPDTLQQFEAAANALKEKTGKYAYHPGAYGQARWYRRTWYAYLWQNGGKLLENNAPAFNDAKGVEALEYLASTVNRGWNKPGTNGAAQFQAGELGMLVNGNWYYFDAAKSNLDWGFVQVPKWFEKRFTWGASHNLVIPKQSKDKEDLLLATAQTIKWISDNSALWGIHGGHIPMNKKALESEELRASRTWKQALAEFSKMAVTGVFRSEPYHPKIAQIGDAIEPHIETAYNGKISPKEALAKAEQAVRDVLKA